jgi:hypothetical protein
MSDVDSPGRDAHRPPCDDVARMSPTANYAGLERRVCPACRLYFDVGKESESQFCSDACRRRHTTPELRADGGTKRVTKRELPIEECLNGRTHDDSNLVD